MTPTKSPKRSLHGHAHARAATRALAVHAIGDAQALGGAPHENPAAVLITTPRCEYGEEAGEGAGEKAAAGPAVAVARRPVGVTCGVVRGDADARPPRGDAEARPLRKRGGTGEATVEQAGDVRADAYTDELREDAAEDAARGGGGARRWITEAPLSVTYTLPS